jgi:cysteine desulfurase
VKDPIYLDHAAATPMSERVLAAMRPYLTERFFNPSSPYLPAVEVRRDYEAAKDALASAIGAKSSDIIMTAGATESVNLAFNFQPADGDNVVVSAIEHPAVLSAARSAANEGNVRYAKVSQTGVLDLADLKNQIDDRTRLVSVALVNNELGTIQPIADAARIVADERQRRMAAGSKTPIYFHCDAAQGLSLLEVNVARLGIDLLTLSAAKICGPKQVGLLWVRPGVRLNPIVYGGGQEMGLRSGTENVAGAVGFAEAVRATVQHSKSEVKRLTGLKSLLLDRLTADIPDLVVLGSPKKQLASFLPLIVPGVDAERLIFLLEQDGVLVATGAACAANKGTKSHVLDAIGVSDEDAAGSLRLTLGRLNDEANVAEATARIVAAVRAERARMGGAR